MRVFLVTSVLAKLFVPQQLVSVWLKIRAENLAQGIFGSVDAWNRRHFTAEDPSERNRQVMEQIYRLCPSFKAQVGMTDVTPVRNMRNGKMSFAA